MDATRADSSSSVNPFARSGPTPNYGQRDDYYVTEEDLHSAEDRRFRLYSHPANRDASEVDLGKMARSQNVATYDRKNALLSPTAVDEGNEEVGSGFFAQAFFWIFIIILGFGLGCGFVFAYSYAQKKGALNIKSPGSPPAVSQPYRG